MAAVEHSDTHCVDCKVEKRVLVRQESRVMGTTFSWSICWPCRVVQWWRDFARLWLEVACRDRKGSVRPVIADAYRWAT